MSNQAQRADSVTWEASVPKRFLVLADHVIDTDTLRLVSTPEQTRLTPKAAAVLLRMAQDAGRTLSRARLLDEVWKGTCPTPDVLTQAITDLRRVLGDDLQSPRYIETLPRRGYRLIAPVHFTDVFARGADGADADMTPSVGEHRVAPAASPTARAEDPHHWMLITAVVLFIAFLALVATLRTPHTVAADAKPHWTVAERWVVAADPGREFFPTISPDGTRVAYTTVGDHAQGQIVQRALQPASRIERLTDSAVEEFYPEWSPDGAWIAYLHSADDAHCQFMRMSSTGGAPLPIAPCAGSRQYLYSWSADSRRLLTSVPAGGNPRNLALASIDVDTGNVKVLGYPRHEGDVDLEPRYSPDGSRIAFRRGTNPYGDLFVMPAAGGEPTALTHLRTRIRGFDWTRDGRALVFSSAHEGQPALYTIGVDDRRIEALGVQPADLPRTARNSDTVVYEIPRQRSQLATVGLDADGGARKDLVPSTGNDTAPAMSPVDDRMAFVSDRGGAQQLWLYDPAADTLVAATRRMPLAMLAPSWRRDGKRLLFTDRGPAGGSAIEFDVARHTERSLTSSDVDVRYATYGKDENTYLIVVALASGDTELVELEIPPGEPALQRVLAHDVGRVEYDEASRRIYFAKATQPGMFSVDEGSGAERIVTPAFTSNHVDGWRLAGGRIYYMGAAAESALTGIHELDPADGSDRIVATLSEEPTDLSFSVMRDRTHFVIAHFIEHDTNVGAFTLRSHTPGS